MKKAFTLIEMTVAVAILAMMITLSSMIFKVSIKTYRTSGATTEIMQKLRAVTDQLNRDFAGIRKDAPILIWFEKDFAYDPNRYDQIMFFANGDFQSTRLYDYGVTPVIPLIPPGTGPYQSVSGNIARIYYGQARSLDLQSNTIQPPQNLFVEDRLLARRRHILSPDGNLDPWPNSAGTNFVEPKNEFYEHDSLTLSHWKNMGAAGWQIIIPQCFETMGIGRPEIDVQYPDMFHKLMCERVSSLAIQIGYTYKNEVEDNNELRWFPSDDPDGDLNHSDSDFGSLAMNNNNFGIYFNVNGLISVTDWGKPEVCETYNGSDAVRVFPDGFVPTALKFTFRLHDSRDIIKELYNYYDNYANEVISKERKGRTFTHIVYIGD